MIVEFCSLLVAGCWLLVFDVKILIILMKDGQVG